MRPHCLKIAVTDHSLLQQTQLVTCGACDQHIHQARATRMAVVRPCGVRCPLDIAASDTRCRGWRRAWPRSGILLSRPHATTAGRLQPMRTCAVWQAGCPSINPARQPDSRLGSQLGPRAGQPAVWRKTLGGAEHVPDAGNEVASMGVAACARWSIIGEWSIGGMSEGSCNSSLMGPRARAGMRWHALARAGMRWHGQGEEGCAPAAAMGGRAGAAPRARRSPAHCAAGALERAAPPRAMGGVARAAA